MCSSDLAIDQVKEEIKEAKQAASQTQVSAPTETNTPTIEPALQAWLDRNDWFGKDRRWTGIVNGIGESLRLENPDLKGQEFLDKLDEVLQEEFPDKFGTSNTASTKTKTAANRVESGSGRAGRVSGSNARSYDNLPPEAKAACDRFVRQKLMTREEYVAEYDWN